MSEDKLGEVEEKTVRIRVRGDDLPPALYVNHVVTQFTGIEVLLLGTMVEVPLGRDGETKIPDHLEATVQARWALPPERYVEHIARSVEFVQSNPALAELYAQVTARRTAGDKQG